MKLRYYFGALVAIIVLSSSSPISWVTFYGKKPIQINTDNKLITVFWNLFSDEVDIKNKVETKIEGIKKKEHYMSYVVLFQSNNNLNLGKRTYIIRFFKTNDEKTKFLNQDTVSIASYDSIFSSPEFNLRLNSIQKKMKVKKVFTILPELLNYKNVQILYNDSSAFKVGKLELGFNDWGRLDTVIIKK
jgi:hypothetical protein